jgi:eukaryotic-like serine/threonine-protein kinase
VDRVSRKLRERIGESLRTIRAGAPLADVTTGSLEALRRYSRALQVQYQGDDERAIALLEETVAQDSNFAMAWRKLGTMLVNAGEHQDRGVEALKHAYRLRDRLTFRERKLTENSYYSDAVGQVDSATAALQSLLAEYPQDSWAHNNLGVMYEVTGDQAAAEQSYVRAATLEPENALALGNVFTVRVGRAEFDSAQATLRLMKQRFPPGPGIDIREVTLLTGRRDFAGAETRLRAFLQQYAADARAQGRALHLLGGVLAVRGKLAEADRTQAATSRLLAGRGLPGPGLSEEAYRALPVGLYRGDRRAAAARLDDALRNSPLEKLGERERPLVDLIHAAIAAGDAPRAKALMAEFERNPGDVPGRVVAEVRNLTRAQVLGMESATLPRALAEVRGRSAPGGCKYCWEAAAADIFDRSNLPDSALAHYERWAGDGEWLWEYGIFEVRQPLAYFRMAELYEAKGDKNRAAEYYNKFAELWKDADAELQPRVKEAKRRIAELAGVGEPSGQRIGVPPKKP